MINDIELMNIPARVLYTHDARSRLLFVNEPGGSRLRAARMFLGRTHYGNIWRFRDDMPENLCQELAALCANEPAAENFDEPPHHLEKYLRLLERHAPVVETTNELAYYFGENVAASARSIVAVTEKTAQVLQGGFEDFVDELPEWQPFVALLENNRAVSICRSARITSEAHEAGVETLPDFRGKGYAAEVTAEWARLVKAAGSLPLYSTSWENVASQAVARKLNLRCYGADFHIT